MFLYIDPVSLTGFFFFLNQQILKLEIEIFFQALLIFLVLPTFKPSTLILISDSLHTQEVCALLCMSQSTRERSSSSGGNPDSHPMPMHQLLNAFANCCYVSWHIKRSPKSKTNQTPFSKPLQRSVSTFFDQHPQYQQKNDL